MTQKEIAGGLVLLAAGEGMKLHEIGSDESKVYNTKIVKDSDVPLYEEVPAESVPVYSKEEYEAKVAELIRQRYSADEESALKRKMLNILRKRLDMLPQPMTMSDDAADKAVAEYDAYNAYAEQCKANAPAAIAEERRAEAARLEAERVAAAENEAVDIETTMVDQIEKGGDDEILHD